MSLLFCRLALHLTTWSNIPDLNYAYVNIYHWRKSLSGKNVHKTYCRNSTYSRMAATINCFVITRKPEIAHEIAQRLLGQKNYPRSGA